MNRLELAYQGNASVYEKMEALRGVLNATSRQECEQAFTAAADAPGEGGKFVDGIDANIAREGGE